MSCEIETRKKKKLKRIISLRLNNDQRQLSDGELSDDSSEPENPREVVRARQYTSGGTARANHDRNWERNRADAEQDRRAWSRDYRMSLMREGGQATWEPDPRWNRTSDWRYDRPRAHSTAAPRHWDDEADDEQDERERVDPHYSRDRYWNEGTGASASREDRNNSSRFGSSKLCKMDPFPKDKKPDEKYSAWEYWKTTFQLAMEKAGIVDERAKAVELMLNVGPELRHIMIVREMVPEEKNVGPNFPFYTLAVEKLEAYLMSLTDRAVDVVKFSEASQKESETAIEFEFRLTEMARRTKATREMVRAQFIKGLRDQPFAQQMYVEGTDLQTMVKNATRKEAMMESNKSASNQIWKGCAVAAISKDSPDRKSPDVAKPSDRQQERHGRSRERDAGGRRQTDRARGWEREGRGRSRSELPKECERCGFTRHPKGYCQAAEGRCRRCNEIGHFAKKCRKQVHTIDLNEGPKVTDRFE